MKLTGYILMMEDGSMKYTTTDKTNIEPEFNGTTGATVDACARCFKESGTDKVYVVTLCIGKGF